MSQKKPNPLFRSPRRRYCPVCGEVTYSRSGIHPQCAVKQADDKRVARLKSRKKPAKKVPQRPLARRLKAWHKWCPKCRNQVHVRKPTCACGHSFATAGSAGSPPAE